ncbi:MAG: alx [Bacteriovoracaceae bacterium]|nr:alx [Bacteriovoracaceae bacterium]
MTQSIQLQDLGTLALLIFLEGALSIDNAVVLALLAGKLPKALQKKALWYGIIGSIIFRVLSLFLANQLMQWNWVKFVGGGYLLYMGISYWTTSEEKRAARRKTGGANSFWKTVILIELMDLAFAADSILAAVAISRKLWVVVAGGLIGMILMRFAASLFIRILEIFPAFEDSAYLLILLIGGKLCIEGFKISEIDFASSSNPASWIFWILMVAALLYGFRKKSGSVGHSQ